MTTLQYVNAALAGLMLAGALDDWAEKRVGRKTVVKLFWAMANLAAVVLAEVCR